MAFPDYIGFLGIIVQYIVLIIGIYTIINFVFSLIGLDGNKWIMKVRLFFRKIKLSRKKFEISVVKSFDINENEDISDFIIRFLDNKFKDYNPNSQKKNNYKIETRIIRYKFDITFFIYINQYEDGTYWINITQRSKIKFKDVSDYLNTTFYNFQLFNAKGFNALNDNVDVMINIFGIEMFKVLFENIGEKFIGNVSLVKKGSKDSLIKVSGVPQIELIPKIKKIIEFGSL